MTSTQTKNMNPQSRIIVASAIILIIFLGAGITAGVFAYIQHQEIQNLRKLVANTNRQKVPAMTLDPASVENHVPDMHPPTIMKPSRFPRILIQSYMTQHPPKGIAKNLRHNLQKNPGWKSLYFDEVDANLFLWRHFPGKISQAMQTLIPGAYRADMFRLAALYVFGGCWIDVYHEFVVKLDALIDRVPKSTNLVVVCDVFSRALYQAFILTTPYNPVILAILEGVADRVLSASYKYPMLGITGPIAFGELLNHHLERPLGTGWDPYVSLGKQNEIFTLNHSAWKQVVTMGPDGKGDVLLNTRFKGYKLARAGMMRHYSHRYNERDVYFPGLITTGKGRLGYPKMGQTWEMKGVPLAIQDCVKQWQKLTDHSFTDTWERRQLVKKSEQATGLHLRLLAHDALAPCDFRAGLASLCHLQMHGGSFADIAVRPVRVDRAWLNGPMTFVLTPDKSRFGTSFMSFPAANNQVVTCALNHLVDLVASRWAPKLHGLGAGDSLTRAFQEHFPGELMEAHENGHVRILQETADGEVIDSNGMTRMVVEHGAREEVCSRVACSDWKAMVRNGCCYRSDALTRLVLT
jgi:hypothetical protein